VNCFILKKINFKEVVKFAVSGGINTILAYCIYSFLIFLGIPYYFALVFDYLFGILFSLLVNYHFTFNVKKKMTVKMLFRMIITYGILFVINEGILFIFITCLIMNSYISQAIASVIIAAISYFLQKIFVFEKGA
jgi:putative flippase GtrA